MKKFKKILLYTQQFLIWLKNIALWSWRGRLLWIFLIAIVFLAIYCKKSSYSLIGNILQLFGAIMILYGIYRKIGFFNNQTLFSLHLKYFKEFPRLRPRNYVLEIHDAIHISTSANAVLTSAINRPEESLADLTRYIDEKFKELNETILKNEKAFQKQVDLLNAGIYKQNNELSSKITVVEDKFKKSSVSDIDKELFGTGCLIAGLIFSIISSF